MYLILINQNNRYQLLLLQLLLFFKFLYCNRYNSFSFHQFFTQDISRDCFHRLTSFSFIQYDKVKLSSVGFCPYLLIITLTNRANNRPMHLYICITSAFIPYSTQNLLPFLDILKKRSYNI